MGNSSSRNRQDREQDDQPADRVEKQRSLRRSVTNFVRRRTVSSRVRPKSWRRQPPTNDVDRPLDSVAESAKDETPVAGPSGESAPLNVPESSSIVMQSVSSPDSLPTAQPPISRESELPEPSASTPEEPVQEAPSGPQISSTAGAAAANRQFPPPGTIVVVQGVVHTTDGLGRSAEAPPSNPVSEPRRRALSAPRPFTPASAESRNRLSNLLQRPRPASAASFDRPSEDPLPPPTSEPHPPNAPSPLSESSSDANTTPTNSPNSSLSSSSVEILGTLLSVAAAATAASLLTNSSESMQSSGLAPPRSAPRPPSFNENPRADRMRNAWGSLRERLGLRNGPSNTASSPPSALDARERMVSEMARAFHLGLGLNNSEGESPGNQTPSRPTSPLASASPPPVPAEGSFERFLLDLQADLRIALTEHDAAIASSLSHPPEPLPEHGRTEMPDVPDDVTTTQSHSMEEDEDVGDSQGDRNSAQTSQDPTRLNWWRLYRFPSIPAPPSAQAGANNTTSTPSQPSPLRDPVPEGTSPTTSAPPVSAEVHTTPVDTTNQPTETSEPSTSDTTVVPIIVIGLQSVNVNLNWMPRASVPAMSQPVPTRRERAASSTSLAADHSSHDRHSPMASTPMADEPPPFLPSLSSLDDDETPSFAPPPIAEPENIPPRTMSDPGPTGARTFLIYVIGGYYPPDHTMVTGEFNNFDSFDALLDLAELLGQVKPPTVSQDEINRSGLEVIKSTQLDEWEKAGRITNNCVERCLICLDEYADEDDVRVMSCRHGFHKDCVDKWMQTGKNNCPACRSTGVPSNEAPPSSVPAPATT